MSRNYKFQNGYSILNISRNQVSKATRKDSRGSRGFDSVVHDHLTIKDFGIIKLYEFTLKSIDSLRRKYSDTIYEEIRE